MKVLGYSFHNLCLPTWYFTDHRIIGKQSKKLQKNSFLLYPCSKRNHWTKVTLHFSVPINN